MKLSPVRLVWKGPGSARQQFSAVPGPRLRGVEVQVLASSTLQPARVAPSVLVSHLRGLVLPSQGRLDPARSPSAAASAPPLLAGFSGPGCSSLPWETKPVETWASGVRVQGKPLSRGPVWGRSCKAGDGFELSVSPGPS